MHPPAAMDFELAMGRDSSVHNPPGIDHLTVDPDEVRPIFLRVHNVMRMRDASRRHWDIVFYVEAKDWFQPSFVGQRAIRQMHCVKEIGMDHYTNWGPKTHSMLATPVHRQAYEDDVREIQVGVLSFDERRMLEEISTKTAVRHPGGISLNDQAWAEAVLKTGVAQGIFEEEDVERALANARSL
ncbi:hypothetical protein PUNSTDRAFT_140837 [Punctularia strigosozonata HHB-11173 SS5]|uniref:uncharacterized protein n=1 Tax=Punctularia strigosozonata (strain HHB-11173) TaxID=741275 RepID=UPI00044184CA|nr:uncharacterized protein PUNSTDRAFT_140837 [Punctularia strigosozonata HHB-11173 SS5]EIN14583.1 hypothetical protein PUNSTDRAFT_140837 [Punctularia strigosozonata HHB-11173 SS5]